MASPRERESHRDRMLAYFVKRGKGHLVSSAEVERQFSDLNHALVGYYLSAFVKDGSIVRVRKGVYELGETVDEKRAKLEEHLKTTPPRVIQGEGWQHGGPSIRALDTTVSLLGRSFGKAIVERMEASGAFVAAEIAFVKKLVTDHYPMSEQQQLEEDRKGRT